MAEDRIVKFFARFQRPPRLQTIVFRSLRRCTKVYSSQLYLVPILYRFENVRNRQREAFYHV